MSAQLNEAHSRRLDISVISLELASDGLITNQQLEAFRSKLRLSEHRGSHPLEILAKQGWMSATRPAHPLSLEKLTEWYAAKCELEYVRIDPLKLDLEAITQVVSQAYAARYQFLPIEVTNDRVTIAVTEPYQREWEETVIHVCGKTVQRVFANPRDVRRYIDEFYTLSKSIAGASERNKTFGNSINLEQLVELGAASDNAADDKHVVRIVDWLLQYAFEQRASDIHLEPRRNEGLIRFRIDGVMQLVNTLPPPVMAGTTSRLKILGRMDVSEKRKPQDGRIKTKTPHGDEVELRASTMPTAFGEKLVLRIFDPHTVIKSYAQLGFSSKEVNQWEGMLAHSNGIILVTGPTGSGKTTTLYSTLKQVAKPEVNVCTIEDPIEMVEPAFNQTQVQHSIGLNFAEGVKTLLRQDPDVIMVGEIRDRDTANIATQAALTGHLVLSTLHTNDAPSAITRLLDLGVPAYLIDSTIIGILAQRLVRTLCPHCKVPGKIDSDKWQILTSPFKVAQPDTAFQPIGCDECRGTGYLGRVGLYEMFDLNHDIRRQIKPGLDINVLRRMAILNGLIPLRVCGARVVALGQTTIDEVLRRVPIDKED